MNNSARKVLSNEEVERDIELNMSSKEGQEMIGRRHSLNTSSRIRKVIVHWAEHGMKLGCTSD